MHTFVNVVETGNFSSAGRKLGISKTLVSKYVAQLEDWLDVLLLHRTTRRVSPTEIGQAYYQRCLPLLEEFAEMESTVRKANISPTGKLVITAPASFTELHLMPMISQFAEQYSEVIIDLRITDRFVDIVEEGVDLAIRIADLPDSSLVARKLAPIRLIACASPAYLERKGEPRLPKDLFQHRCVIDSNFAKTDRWPFRQHEKTSYLQMKAQIHVNSARAIRELVLSGVGISLCPIFAVADDIREGRLKILLEPFESHALGLYAIYSQRRHLSAKVRLFIDSLVVHLSKNAQW